MPRHMHLNLFIHSRGHHEASWRHPASSTLPLTDIRYTVEMAQKAEAGLFDSIFLADVLGLWNDVEKTPFNWLEPVTTLAALSMVTRATTRSSAFQSAGHAGRLPEPGLSRPPAGAIVGGGGGGFAERGPGGQSKVRERIISGGPAL